MKRDEFEAILGELYATNWQDPALIPECLALSLTTMFEIADEDAPVTAAASMPRYAAEQALRRMAQRAKTGVPIYEPEDIRG